MDIAENAENVKNAENTADRILDTLNGRELMIGQIAEKLDIHRATASKYLTLLELSGKIIHRNEGRAQLYSLAKEDSAKRATTTQNPDTEQTPQIQETQQKQYPGTNREEIGKENTQNKDTRNEWSEEPEHEEELPST